MPSAPRNVPSSWYDRAVGNYVTQCLHRCDSELVSRIRFYLSTDSAKDGRMSADLQRELWKLSAQNRQEIVNKLEAGVNNDLVGLFKWVTDWQKTMTGMAKKKRQFSWIVTNIGVMDGNSDSWFIERAQLGLSAETPAAAIEFALVSVAGEGMNVTASWSDCAVSQRLAASMTAGIERWLAQLVGQSLL